MVYLEHATIPPSVHNPRETHVNTRVTVVTVVTTVARMSVSLPPSTTPPRRLVAVVVDHSQVAVGEGTSLVEAVVAAVALAEGDNR